MRLLPDRWANHCRECGVRIRWTERAYLGNKYTPVVCSPCALASSVRAYGSADAYYSALAEAKRKLDAEVAA